MAEGRQIQAIDKASVAKICSGQVILDLAIAVKELVENALDAGATSVEVRLKEHGLQLIEVADNGRGVQPQDYENLALKYHTSKLSQFSDLEGSHTFFGFRGEALSSLAALSELSVITRTADEAAATKLEFDKHGKLVNSTACARAVGTTVSIKDLFATLPVRRQDLARNVRKEVAKLRLLLQQYAILTGQAQLFASDQAGKAPRVVLVSTSNAGPGLRDRVSAVLGAKVAAVLQPIAFELASEGVKVTGLVSRAGCGVKGEKLRQFCCVNGRPVELPRAVKTLNDTYKSLYSSMVGLKPMAFLQFELPAGTFDINVTPDKRSVFIQKEVAIMAALGQALQALWEPSRYSYTLNSTGQLFDSQRPAAARTAAAAAAGNDDDSDIAEDAAADSDSDSDEEGLVALRQQQQQQQNQQGRQQNRTYSQAAAAATTVPSSLASFLMGATPPAAAAAAAPAVAELEKDAQEALNPAEAAATASPHQHLAMQRPAKRLLETDADDAEGSQGKSVRARLSSASGAANPAAATAADEIGGTDMTEAAEVDSSGGEQQQYSKGQQLRRPGRRQQQQQPPECGSDSEHEVSSLSDEDLDVQPEQQQQQQHAGSRGRRGALGTLQQQHRRQQQPIGISLAAFSMHGSGGGSGSGSGPTGGHQQQQRQQQQSGGIKQQSLAACGFQITVIDAPKKKSQHQHQQHEWEDPKEVWQPAPESEQQQQQQQQQQHKLRLQWGQGMQQQDKQGSAGDVSLDFPPEGNGDDGESRQEPTNPKTARASSTRGIHGADAAAAGDELPGDDADVILVDDDIDDSAPAGDDTLVTPGQQQLQQQQQPQDVTIQQQQQQSDPGPPIVLQYSMQQLMADVQLRMQQEQRQQQQQQQQTNGINLVAASLQGGDNTPAANTQSEDAAVAAAAVANDAATSELARQFDKGDFAVMQPVGQFNLGFIIARLKQDLFIIDQHAADEKSTFERLMGSYTVNKQPLLQPKQLTTLTPMDQQVIRENMEVFKRNGFDFVEAQQQQQQQQPTDSPKQPIPNSGAASPSASREQYAPAATADDDAGYEASGELLLSAVPLVRGSGASGVLGEEALTELLDIMASGEQRPDGIRPKRVRDMLASRACRTSIMIGSPLTQQQQARIVARLAELDAPWNCPHGRPTMRHLAVLPPRSSS